MSQMEVLRPVAPPGPLAVCQPAVKGGRVGRRVSVKGQMRQGGCHRLVGV